MTLIFLTLYCLTSFPAIRCDCFKMDCRLKTAGRRVKLVEIRDTGTLVQHIIWDTFVARVSVYRVHPCLAKVMWPPNFKVRISHLSYTWLIGMKRTCSNLAMKELNVSSSLGLLCHLGLAN